MQRREFLSAATIMLGGMVHSRSLLALLNGENQHMTMAADFTSQPVDVFTPTQRSLVAAITDTIIPATDLPGALDAGVPKFIELMAAHWMTEAERAELLRGMTEIEQLSKQLHQQPLADCLPEQRMAVLEQLEARYCHHPWYQQGCAAPDDTVEVDPDKLPFIAQIKEFTVFGFFISEVGCKQVLRYNPMPGRFDADIPLDANDSSWVPTPLM